MLVSVAGAQPLARRSDCSAVRSALMSILVGHASNGSARRFVEGRVTEGCRKEKNLNRSKINRRNDIAKVKNRKVQVVSAPVALNDFPDFHRDTLAHCSQ